MIIWLNGKKIDHAFSLFINENTNSLKRLTYAITNHCGRQNSDRIKVFNQKGLEIDDADISYLVDKQTLYVSFDGKRKI